MKKTILFILVCLFTISNLSAQFTSQQLSSAQAIINEDFVIKGEIYNSSTEAITSIKYAYEINETSTEKTITTNVAVNSGAIVEFPVNSINESGIYSIKITILEINGKTDLVTSNNSKTTDLVVGALFFDKKVVVEEGTGTWCQYCPRGMVGMAMMKEKYPESFIGIAVHVSDVMAVSYYVNAMLKYFANLPSCVVNRKDQLHGDPYFDIEKFYLSEMETKAIAGIKLSGSFTSAEKTEIDLTTLTTFGFPETKASYKLAYVLIENEVTGSGSNYYQINAYAGTTEPMGGYENKPAVITDQVYEEVARAIHAPLGLANSVPTSFTELEELNHSQTIKLPSNINNKDNVEVIVMLLNAKGEVVNADKMKMKDMPTVGIKDIEETNSMVSNIRKTDNSLSFELQSSNSALIHLYDVCGRLIYSQKQQVNGVQTISIPTSGMKGIFLLKVQSKDKVVGKKVIL